MVTGRALSGVPTSISLSLYVLKTLGAVAVRRSLYLMMHRTCCRQHLAPSATGMVLPSWIPTWFESRLGCNLPRLL